MNQPNTIPDSCRHVSSRTATPVAVIMSVYGKDDPKLFDRALTSIENQDYDDGPVRIYLCIDGPVGTEILDVIRAHEDRIYKIVRNESNLGLARSLNKLLDALEDEQFVFRMDSDDYSHANRVSLQVETMRRRPDVDILGGSIREVDENGRVMKVVHYPDGSADISKYITRRSPLAHPTVCFRRSAVERFGRYPELPTNQDWALWFRCLRAGLTLSSIREVLVDMTVTESFFRRRGAKRALDEFRVLTSGIWQIHGLSWRFIYPMLRLLFRLAPSGLIKAAYRSRLR